MTVGRRKEEKVVELDAGSASETAGDHDQDLPGFQRPGDGFGRRWTRGWRRRRRRDGDRTPGGSGAGPRSHERDPAERAGNHRLPAKVCRELRDLWRVSGWKRL